MKLLGSQNYRSSAWRILTIAWCFLLVTLPAGEAKSDLLYRVTDLGDLQRGSGQSFACGISEAGHVTGRATTASGVHAFFWQNGLMTDLGALPGGNNTSFGSGVNSSGVVTGYSNTGSRNHGFIWERGTMSSLGDFPGGDDTSSGAGINETGIIVGGSNNGDPMAFRWENGSMTLVGDLPGGQNSSFAFDINELGQIVGESGVSVGNHAFLKTGTTMIDLGALPGGNGSSSARAINNQSDVVGISDVNGDIHAFYWSNGVMQELSGFADGDGIGYAFDINDSGDVVGRVSRFQSGFHAAGWFNGQVVDLNDRLEGQFANWTLIDAFGINDLGQIVGSGLNPDGRFRGYVLTPVPEPGQFFFLVACTGWLVFGLIIRNRKPLCN